jgi:hypothetical protein
VEGREIKGEKREKMVCWWMQKFLIPVCVQTVPNYKPLSGDVKFRENREREKKKEAKGVSSK